MVTGDFRDFTSKQIVDLVRKNTGKRITLSLKSKKSIIKKAEELMYGASIVSASAGCGKTNITPVLKAIKALTGKKAPPFIAKEFRAKEIKAVFAEVQKEMKDALKELEMALLEINEIK